MAAAMASTASLRRDRDTSAEDRTRCAWAVERCAVEEPALVTLGPDHRAACWVAEERNGHA